MPSEPEKEISQTPDNLSPSSQAFVDRFVETRDTDLISLLPSQVETGKKLEEQQEETRSKLATFLIRILAGTLTASFSLILVMIVSVNFVSQDKVETFDKNSSLVKDLITFILTAQTGLIGTALGFYFGSRGNKS